ncbi:TetR family transcriptional regulator C-terminal domain-containing protein [Novosphingobium sp. EMRT-2]|uniref:TetR family transcriptional regulator C-terminal domain-containing protein n=1 Tax=Novosphingobium sp. EMRT-2 TaxID=2571749 RepID=UPI00143D9AC3|nr:TetR family transcriptional regulator C-terminal domain-containing protein [Novosphingobium sp. EMRT-2]
MTEAAAISERPLRKPRAKRQPPTVRRQDLLAITVSCLARLGPRGATGREICRQAGVSHGLLRHYFQKPDNLLFETYELLCDQLITHLEEEVGEIGPDPWAALSRFFSAAFSKEWASADVIGAWMAFWQLARGREDFAVVSARFNARQRALMERIIRQLPGADQPVPIADSIAILSAVLDGLWIEFYLSEERTPKDRCIALCEVTAKRLFCA